MRRIFALTLALVLTASSVFAAVHIEKDGSSEGVATTLNFTPDASYSTNGSTFNLPMNLDLISAGVDDGGVTTVATGPDALPSSYSMAYVTLASHTLTLANGVPGQIFTVIGAYQTDTGTVTLTASTKTGWQTAAIADVGDSITLLYLNDTSGWIVVGTNSVTVTHY